MRAFYPVFTGLLFALAVPGTARAQDAEDEFSDDEDDEDFFGEEDETPADEDRLEDGDEIKFEDEDEDDLEDFSDSEDETDLLGNDPEAQVNDSGDTAGTYRAAIEGMAGMTADEEIAAWEVYLGTYQGTPYTTKINGRIEELTDQMYNGGLDDNSGQVDAMRQQLSFSQAMQLENINPRNRLQAGFEWGLPDHINLIVDYERAFVRNFSGHIGVRNRYTGWNLETGVHWALVKSKRTDTLITFLGDVHFNTSPAFLGVRPQLAFGKRLGKLDLQAQAGVDLELQNPLGMRVIGGLNGNLRATDTVGIFLESGINMKNFGWEGSVFMYNVATFGMKFFPKQVNGVTSDDIEVNMGATVPYARQYWAYHYGSVMGQVNYNMD